jgi:predicted nucleic acid-binding protein
MNCCNIIVDLSIKNKWEIYLPGKVINELTKGNRRLDKCIDNNIKQNKIVIIYCNPITFGMLQKKFSNLGEGELEAISIVTDCIQKLPNPYVVLSDDNRARKKAENLGIKFINILSILLLANHQHLLNKSIAMKYLKELQKNNFTIKSDAYNAFVSSLK